MGELGGAVVVGIGANPFARLPQLAPAALGRGRDLARLLVRYERPLQIVIGLALVAVGIWDLSVNLPAFLAGTG